MLSIFIIVTYLLAAYLMQTKHTPVKVKPRTVSEEFKKLLDDSKDSRAC